MELRELEKVNPMTVDFRGLSITFNPDAFTDGFFYAVADRFRERFTAELQAAIDETPSEANDNLPVEAQRVRALVNQIADRIKLEGDRIDGEKRFYAALLVGTPDSPVLLEWDLTDNSIPVPCNETGLLTLKHKTLEDLWMTVRDAANPKSQGVTAIPEKPTTSETTLSPSVSPETPPDDAQVM